MLLGLAVHFWSQLRERQRWRRLCLSTLPSQPLGSQAPQQQSEGRETARSAVTGVPTSWQPAQREHPELSIVHVWPLHLPQALALLILAFAAGQGGGLLYYMI